MLTKKDDINNLFSALKKIIKKINPRNIDSADYPLYVTFYNKKSDLVFAVIYKRKDHIEMGMNLTNKDPIKGLKSAKHMKYPNISKALILKKTRDLTVTFKKLLKTSYHNSQVDT